MLKLIDIKKDYKVGDTITHALKGINVSFRKNEFVSILGPSGCGKTTLLNIIGGLDKYTSGDLIINNKSTKEYKDRDWDIYRNHRIGFIFQSYNLIPHQTILENVELALTIAGISKEERVKKAKDALDQVGLKDQYKKHPNQLSGGQCQRVAIARALVNEPEILLADEPTGALDTKTSIQIMELIKDISKSKLVIMVTHNPELAQKYSSRIIKLLDGELIEDSLPYKEEAKEVKDKVNSQTNEKEKAKMSLWTAFKLSFRNLKSKFKRTLMVCIASSIGIIGVSSVLSFSTGIKNYITSMEDDMLSGNPITIARNDIDLAGMMNMMSTSDKKKALEASIKDGYVNVDSLIDYLASQGESLNNMQITNDINKDYIEYLNSMPKEYYQDIKMEYGINSNISIYTDANFLVDGTKKMSISRIFSTYSSLLALTEFKDYLPLLSTLKLPFSQTLSNQNYIMSQYDYVSDKSNSHLPSKENEIMIVLTNDQALNDLLLAQLGYFTQEQFLNLVYKATNDPRFDKELYKTRFSVEELMNKKFTWYPNDTIFTKIDTSDLTSQQFKYNSLANDNWSDKIDFEITAIIKPKDGLNFGSLTPGFYYTKEFENKVIEKNLNSQIVNYIQDVNMDMPLTNIFYPISVKLDNNSPVVPFNKIGVGTIQFYLNTNQSPTYLLSSEELGGYDTPSKISIYPLDFNRKHLVTNYLDNWNKDHNEIRYSDRLEVIISMMNQMIDMVTIGLVAFTSLSLVVSTVMIGIIIYVSVIERIKEIGVIRALGGRKKDVSHLFNAESIIIGTSSGLLGVGFTYLLCLIVNIVVKSNFGISSIAILPISYALIIILVSVLLTCISGFVPARLASKKDPVIALRTE